MKTPRFVWLLIRESFAHPRTTSVIYEDGRVERLPEWRCPSCGATTRARMTDHLEEQP